MRRRNTIALGVVLAALAGLVVWALRPQPISVEVVEVTKGVFEQTVSDDGQTRVRDRYVIAAVWGGRIVSESTLTTQINAVRRALGDTGDEQQRAGRNAVKDPIARLLREDVPRDKTDAPRNHRPTASKNTSSRLTSKGRSSVTQMSCSASSLVTWSGPAEGMSTTTCRSCSSGARTLSATVRPSSESVAR